MEFNGRIRNVLPARTGTSVRTGNQWKSLPFVFEYKEQETDPYPDSVVLETFDTNVINGIESCCQKDGEGHPIVQNDEYILLRDIYVCIGFRHKARVFTPKDGKPSRYITDMRINSIHAIRPPQQGPQIGQQQPVQRPVQQQQVLGGPQTPPFNPFAQQQSAAPFPPEVDQYGNPINQGGQNDDLPF